MPSTDLVMDMIRCTIDEPEERRLSKALGFINTSFYRILSDTLDSREAQMLDYDKEGGGHPPVCALLRLFEISKQVVALWPGVLRKSEESRVAAWVAAFPESIWECHSHEPGCHHATSLEGLRHTFSHLLVVDPGLDRRLIVSYREPGSCTRVDAPALAP